LENRFSAGFSHVQNLGVVSIQRGFGSSKEPLDGSWKTGRDLDRALVAERLQGGILTRCHFTKVCDRIEGLGRLTQALQDCGLCLGRDDLRILTMAVKDAR
jgi:hypothetical protein